MKYRDITYKMTKNLIAPEKMGILATEYVDYLENYRRYSIPPKDVERANRICMSANTNDEIIEEVSTEESIDGLYRRYIYYFIIETSNNTAITYYPYIPECSHRHWINGDLAFIGGPLYVNTIVLKKGKNVICVEKYSKGIPQIRIQISDKEKMISLTDNYWFKQGYFDIVHNKHIQNGENFKFNLIPLDLVNFDYDTNITMLIKSGEDKRIISKENVSFKEIYDLDLSYIPNMNEDECERLYVEFIAKGKNGQDFKNSTYLFRYKIREDYLDKLRDKASLFLKKEIPRILKNEISYYLEIMTEEITNFYYGFLLKRLLEYIESGNIEKYLFSPGGHNIYYHSDIDNHYHHCYVVLPQDYKRENEYPLLLSFQYGSINNYEPFDRSPNFSVKFANRRGTIYADIGGDGCTMGSYLGEIFLQSDINSIFENYKINKKKIYAISNCAGNIAAINFVETFPHLFAGLYFRYITPNDFKYRISNLSNIKCIALFSGNNKKYSYYERLFRRKIKDIKIIHSNKNLDKYVDLMISQYTPLALDSLMEAESNEYPRDFSYTTRMNRYRKAYYVEIDSILPECETATVKGTLLTEKEIVIYISGCKGFTIQIPPYINREDFCIVVNEEKHRFNRYDSEIIHFELGRRNKYIVTDKKDIKIDYIHGAGLADVYLTPMKVVNCNSQSNEMTRVCNVFAKPDNNTIVSSRISYPIIDQEDIDNNINNSLVIVDACSECNNTIKSIKSQLPIQVEKEYLTYNGKKQFGSYCVLQVIPNPWNRKYSILYINSNDESLFSKNILTRKLILPSYLTGVNKYLNSRSIIFDGLKYFICEK